MVGLVQNYTWKIVTLSKKYKKGMVSLLRIGYVIYQTRETVFHRDIQTPRRELKIRRAAEYF